MWAIARFDFGLTDDEFGDLTYKLFDALVARKESEEKKQFMRTGMVASAVMNFSMCHPDKHVSMMDFVPGHEEKKDLDKMEADEVSAHLMSQFSKKEYHYT